MARVIRFIVLYKKVDGVAETIEHLILGVGFLHSGHSHATLLHLYFPNRKTKDPNGGYIYAGYLHVDKDDKIVIYEDGGSQTLGIPKNPHEDEIFVRLVDVSPKLKKALIALYPLIAEAKIANVVLSADQKATAIE